jgi:16S rRNA G966 N2-methylase RsmD
LRRVALLPSGQAEGQRVAEGVAGSVQLGGEAAARAAKRLLTFGFFAPAAQAWARTTVLSSITHS